MVKQPTRSAIKRHSSVALPSSASIPDKLYFRIGEVARLCGVETYVLRFWQSEFQQLRPNKSGTGQRLYRKRDVEMALRIKRLLHDEGYTIAGARQVLADEARQGLKLAQPELPLAGSSAAPARPKQGAPAAAAAPAQLAAEDRIHAKLERMRRELKELLGVLSVPPAGARPKKAPTSRDANRPTSNLFEE